MRRSGIVTRSFSATAVRPAPASVSVPPPARSAATNRPTPQFTSHHDVTEPRVDSAAFRQGWRVATRLDGLLESGKVDRDGHDAACRWRAWAETVTARSTQAWSPRVDLSTGPGDGGMVRRLHHAGQLRAAADALGPIRIRLLTLCVLEDRSWREIATAFRLSDKTVVAWTVEAVGALADHLAGRPVPPPPVLRPRVQPGSW
jgi:hypothetical protein